MNRNPTWRVVAIKVDPELLEAQRAQRLDEGVRLIVENCMNQQCAPVEQARLKEGVHIDGEKGA